MKHFRDVMFDDLTQEQMDALTKEQLTLWLFRPKPDDLPAARTAMYLRVAIIVLGSFYLYSQSQEGAFLIIFALLGYEYAYYNTRDKKAALHYELARQEYVTEVEQLEHRA